MSEFSMQHLILLFPFLIAVLLVIGNIDAYNNWVGVNAFTLWNCVPPVLAAGVLIQRVRAQSQHSNRRFRHLWSGIGFAAGVLGATLFFYLAWRFNWWEVRTSSSTSGLIFVVLPVIELTLGLICFGVGLVLAKLNRDRTSLLSERSQNSISFYVLTRLAAVSVLVFAALSAYTASRA
jgi:hypothetical protein